MNPETPRTDDLKGGSGQYLGQHLQNNTNILTHISKGESSEVEKIKKAIKHLYADRGVVSGVQLHEIFSAINFVTKPTTQATAMQEKQTTDTKTMKPTKCDFCGSGLKPVRASEEIWVFDCGSYLDPCDDERIIQSEKCKSLESKTETPKSETPRTDKIVLPLKASDHGFLALLDHARHLERELNEANQFKTDAYAQIESLNQQLEETKDVRDSWCEEFTKTRNELYATQQRLREMTEVARELAAHLHAAHPCGITICGHPKQWKTMQKLARLEKLEESK